MANKNKTIVIGVGRLGSGIANRAAAKGQDVIVVDPNPKAFYGLDDTFSGFKVNADSTDMFALEEHCDIKTAGQVVIVTGDERECITTSGGSLTATVKKSWALDNGTDSETPADRITVKGTPATASIEKKSVVVTF